MRNSFYAAVLAAAIVIELVVCGTPTPFGVITMPALGAVAEAVASALYGSANKVVVAAAGGGAYGSTA